MKISYESSFEKDLKHIKDKKLFARVKQIIEEIKQSDDLDDIKNMKKMKGYDTFYRIRLGNYRMGIEVVEEEVIITRLLHRKDIYRYFP
ncbi:type II toxin-antitoxin system RelE/ParE family toxin [Candidatus Halobeggiatoa sp. HSG11]|nr:type II toxin-antitoxin system RelE/ParE family toxin [Candidatus Halobeggiatoa sp. HSG11]